MVSFLTECSWSRVLETVQLDAGRVLVHGEEVTRVLATFDPESCIAFLERLERKTPNKPAPPLQQLDEWRVEEKKIWRVQAKNLSKSLLSGKSEHFGFYPSKELAQRVHPNHKQLKIY